MALAERRDTIREKLTKRERKKEKNSQKSSDHQPNEDNSNGAMSEIEEQINGAANGSIPSEMLPSEKVLEEEAKERAEEEERRKNREPAIVFRTVDVNFLMLFVDSFF